MHIEDDHQQEIYCSVSQVLLEMEVSGLHMDAFRF